MARKRLSWDEEKVAEIMKQADPYTMNQDRKNPPVEKYRTGDPSAWAEDPDMKTPWKGEGRTETGHPAPAREAVVQARKLEDKALKCLTIAQRMLPGADESFVEDQATDLMFLPEKSIMATLQRQTELATKLAKGCMKSEEDMEDEKEAGKKEEEMEEEKEAGKKEDMEEEKEAGKKKEEKPEEEEVTAKKIEEMEEEKEAGKKEEEMEEEKEAGKKKEEKPEEEKVSAKKEEKPEEEEEKEKKAGSDQDLLDILFDGAEVQSSEPKTGAKKLSGLVKKASSGNSLDTLWDAPPDVSHVFK